MAYSVFRHRIVYLAVFLLVFSGCGYGDKDKVPVQGRVLFDGASVDGGAITFIPAANPKEPWAGGRITGGKYSLPAGKGLTPGTYRVQISWKQKTGKQVPTPGDKENLRDEMRETIPEKYNKNTTLTAELKASANTVDFLDLKP